MEEMETTMPVVEETPAEVEETNCEGMAEKTEESNCEGKAEEVA